MTRERTLGAVGIGVLLVMTGLLSRTQVNGRWLDLPGSRKSERLEAAGRSLRHEIMAVAREQEAYHAVRLGYAQNLDDLDYASDHDNVTIVMQSADRMGWTAAAVNGEAQTVCLFGGGTGPAAVVESDAVSLPESHAEYEVTGRCEEWPESVTPQVISSTNDQ